MASLPWLPFPYSPYFPRFSGAFVLAFALKVMLHGTGRDESQRRFLAHHSVVMLEQYCNLSKQLGRSNVATLHCAKNRPCEIVSCNITFSLT